MGRVRFPATIDMEAWRSHRITVADDLILLRYPAEARARIRTELKKIVEKDILLERAGKPKTELDVTIEIQYKPRSLDANRLMFKLYHVLADVLNAEAKSMNKITAEELYEKDMEDWAPKHQIKCDDKSLPFVVEILEKEKGKVRSKKWTGEQWVLEIWQTSSYWNTKQQSEHIDRLFVLLETMGRDWNNNGDVALIFKDFKSWKKKEETEDEGNNGERRRIENDSEVGDPGNGRCPDGSAAPRYGASEK